MANSSLMCGLVARVSTVLSVDCVVRHLSKDLGQNGDALESDV